MEKQLVEITGRASGAVCELVREKNSSSVVPGSPDAACIGLKVSIKQGGCSGLSYEFEYMYDSMKSDIKIHNADGADILYLDNSAVMFLAGSVLDYQESDVKAGFLFKNPNEKGACGCGESFHV